MHRGYLRTTAVLPALALAVAACSTAAPTAAPTNAPTPTASPTAAPTAVPTAAPSPTIPGLVTGKGAAGTFRTRQFNPQVILTLAQGWGVYFDELNGTYMNLGRNELLVGKSGDVIDPATHQRADNPDDVMAWIVANPELHVTGEPTPITISGYDASYVDVEPTHSVDVFYDPLGNFHVGPGIARFYVIPWDGPDMFVAVLKSEFGTWEDALTNGVPVAESLQIVP